MGKKKVSINLGGSECGGLGIGAIIAVLLSWTTNHSIAWAILHGFCGWFYVIYWAIGNA